MVAAEKDGTALILVNLTADALDAQSIDAVHEVRDAVHGVAGADAQVGGWTAVTIDIQEASSRDNKVVIPIMLLAVMLILMGLLRALTSPLILIGTVILSFGAALGISGVVFDLIYDRPHTDPGFPLYAFVFLVALGIDYNIFLMTRVREETATSGTRRGSLIALASTGGVITAAGIVLAATFGALATMPLTFALQIGTAIALGRPARHDDRPVGAGHRDQPRPRAARSGGRARSTASHRWPRRRSAWPTRAGEQESVTVSYGGARQPRRRVAPHDAEGEHRAHAVVLHGLGHAAASGALGDPERPGRRLEGGAAVHQREQGVPGRGLGARPGPPAPRAARTASSPSRRPRGCGPR